MDLILYSKVVLICVLVSSGLEGVVASLPIWVMGPSCSSSCAAVCLLRSNSDEFFEERCDKLSLLLGCAEDCIG